MDPEQEIKTGEDTTEAGAATDTGANASANSGEGQSTTTAPADKSKVEKPAKSEKAKDKAVDENPTKKASSEKSVGMLKKAKMELELMDKLKVDKLFSNTKGEYFTTENLAHLSEPKKENVKQISRSVLEVFVKSAE